VRAAKYHGIRDEVAWIDYFVESDLSGKTSAFGGGGLTFRRGDTDRDIELLWTFSNITKITVQSPNLSKAAFEKMAELPTLTQLTIDCDARIRSDQLSKLQHAPALEELTVYGDVSDADLRYISKIETLRRLYLDDCLIRGDGLSHLSSLANLERLDVFSSVLDSKSIETSIPLFPRSLKGVLMVRSTRSSWPESSLMFRLQPSGTLEWLLPHTMHGLLDRQRSIVIQPSSFRHVKGYLGYIGFGDELQVELGRGLLPGYDHAFASQFIRGPEECLLIGPFAGSLLPDARSLRSVSRPHAFTRFFADGTANK